MTEQKLQDLVESPGVESQTRFLVVAHERSASTLAIRSLGEHPWVSASYEVFNNSPVHRELLRLWGKRQWSDHEDPVAFTKRYLFRAPAKANIRAQGFKIFYQHCRATEKQRSLWNYLEAETEIKIILMYRENLAKAFISFQRAMVANEWNVSVSSLTPEGYNTPIKIDVEACLSYIERKQRHFRKLKHIFADHRQIEISYEAMTGDYDGSIARLWDFLDVPPILLDQPIRKLSHRPLQEVVTNYDELKSALNESDLSDRGWLE